jgi:flavin reductase (DIM6/NTAB) family NADH-FMN oxidoreductase RutF
MLNKFSEVIPSELDGNFIKMIGHEWFLITAGNIEAYNTMTAAWGGIGFLWQKPVVYTFVRPVRHTFHFTEENDYFTLSFFGEKYRDILQYCGTKSGKDVDKAHETGLIPFSVGEKSVAFEQAKLIILCRKLYSDFIKPENFTDISLDKHYPLKDYHKMYIGEIVKCYVEK